MGAAEAVPFGTREAADAFMAANGGKVVRFEQIPPDYVLGGEAPGEPSERGAADARLN
jgi:copper chaperone NosL